MVMLPEPSGTAEAYSEPGARLRDALLEHFLKYPEYILLRWNLTTYAVLLKGETARMEELSERCVETVRRQYAAHAPEQSWYVAIGRPTQRLSTLPVCFEEVSRLWAYRHILPQQHVLTADTVSFLTGTSSGNSQAPSKVSIKSVFAMSKNSCIVFLSNGSDKYNKFPEAHRADRTMPLSADTAGSFSGCRPDLL